MRRRYCYFGPEKNYKITTDKLHMATDYTPFEGMEVTGKLTHTSVGGKVIVENGELVNEKCRGEFVKQGLPILD